MLLLRLDILAPRPWAPRRSKRHNARPPWLINIDNDNDNDNTYNKNDNDTNSTTSGNNDNNCNNDDNYNNNDNNNHTNRHTANNTGSLRLRARPARLGADPQCGRVQRSGPQDPEGTKTNNIATKTGDQGGNKCRNPDFLGFSKNEYVWGFSKDKCERVMGGELFLSCVVLLNERFWGCLKSHATVD